MNIITMKKFLLISSVFLLFQYFGLIFGETQITNAPIASGGEANDQWWILPLSIFVFTFFLGIVSIAAGIGGGVLFVPIVSSFFPIGIDFVRGAGLLVALSGALSASPTLLKKGLANLRIAIPMSLSASVGALFGAQVGLTLSANLVQTLLGVAIVGIVLIFIFAKKSEIPEVSKADAISKFLGIGGQYYEVSQKRTISWHIHRSILALFLFIGIGFLAGMFGLGAGWANVPVLNLVLGVPLKIAVATSIFILSITDTTAAWVYLNNSAVLPIVAIPAMMGMMLGTRFGVKVLEKTSPALIKRVVIVLLALAGINSLLTGLGVV